LFADIRDALIFTGVAIVLALLVFALIYFGIPALGFGATGIAAGKLYHIIDSKGAYSRAFCEPRLVGCTLPVHLSRGIRFGGRLVRVSDICWNDWFGSNISWGCRSNVWFTHPTDWFICQAAENVYLRDKAEAFVKH
jgi:hypothetical protein